MVYGSLAGVKEWLQIASTNTQYDTELTNIQEYVDQRIRTILRKYVSDPSSLSSSLTAQLADIENEWTAGVFKMRRSGAIEAKDQPLINDAMKRLDEFIESNFKKEFWKLSLKAMKGLFREEKGKVVKVGKG